LFIGDGYHERYLNLYLYIIRVKRRHIAIFYNLAYSESMEIQQKHHELDLGKILKPYENKWVGLSEDKTAVISSGDSLTDAINDTPKNKKDKVSFMHVIPLGSYFAPICS